MCHARGYGGGLSSEGVEWRGRLGQNSGEGVGCGGTRPCMVDTAER